MIENILGMMKDELISNDRESSETTTKLCKNHGKRKVTRGTRILIMLCMTLAFFIVEVVFGYLSHSMALIADSFHMLSDVMALSIAFACLKVSFSSLIDVICSEDKQRKLIWFNYPSLRLAAEDLVYYFDESFIDVNFSAHKENLLGHLEEINIELTHISGFFILDCTTFIKTEHFWLGAC